MPRVIALTILLAVFFVASCTPGASNTAPYKPSGDIEKGRDLYGAFKTEEAEAEFIEVLRKNPDDALALYYMGLISLDRAMPADARKYFVRALELNPSTEFCSAIQQVMLLDNSRIVGSGKGFWMTPSFWDSSRVLALAVTNDTDADGRVSTSDHANIVFVNLTSRNSEVLVPDTSVNGPATADSALTRITYASIRTDTNKDRKTDMYDNPAVFVMDVAERKERRIVDDTYFNVDPSFSADGQSVYFASIRIDTNNDGALDIRDNFAIYRFDLQTGETSKVCALPGDCRRPLAASDSSCIYFWGVGEDTNGDGNIDADDSGGIFRYTLDPAGIESVIGWRNSITYLNYDIKGSKMIIAMDPWPGEGISFTQAAESDPARFGAGIYFVNLVSSSRKKALAPTTDVICQPALAPDGHTIAFQRTNTEGTYYVCFYFDTDKPNLTAAELIKALKNW